MSFWMCMAANLHAAVKLYVRDQAGLFNKARSWVRKIIRYMSADPVAMQRQFTQPMKYFLSVSW